MKNGGGKLEMVPVRRSGATAYDLVTEFANDGTTQYRVSGDLELVDASGKTMRKFEYKSFPVLPGVPREAVFRVDEPLPDGSYVLRALIDVGMRERLAAETRVRVGG